MHSTEGTDYVFKKILIHAYFIHLYDFCMKVIYSTDNEVILEIDLDIDWANYQKNIDFFFLLDVK